MPITDREHPSRFRRRLRSVLALLALAVPTSPLAAQQPAYEQGVAGTSLLLRQLEGVKRVLMIGAHPDDEDTALLTTLARRYGAETAYLALTRGDGGQNLIGPELFEGLGVVRTGELLAARGLDGGRQYFTRAFDFGYSKNADEALRLWPRDELLRDVVWVVRTFRPQVIVSVFTGTPADGHGQHQAAGIMAAEVFAAAADPSLYAELADRGAEPWQASKFYRLAWRTPGEATIAVETGAFDPVLGRSHYQLAMESRSQHRSQDMGAGQPLGPRTSGLVLVDVAPGLDIVADDGLFAGVDTTLIGRAAPLPEGTRERVALATASYQDDITTAGAELSPLDPTPSTAALVSSLGHLDDAIAIVANVGPAGSAFRRVAERKRSLAEEALLSAAGVVVRSIADDDLVVPGDTLGVTIEVWNGGNHALADARPSFVLPAGWSAEGFVPDPPQAGGGSPFRGGPTGRNGDPDVGADLAPGDLVRWHYRVEIPPHAEPSRLFYRAEDRDGEMYRWPDEPGLWGRPKDPPPLTTTVEAWVEVDGQRTRVAPSREVRYLGVDKATGEFWKPLLVMPAVSVATAPGAMAWPAGLDETREVSVQLRAETAARGSASLEVPQGWRVEPAAVGFAFEGPGQTRSVAFRVTPAGAGPGRHVFRAVAELEDGRRYDEGYDLIDYPHIERTAFFRPAVAEVEVLPVQVGDALRVGYIMGSGDDGVLALRQMGVEVELVSPERLSAGDLGDFDALVLGIRVYETRPDAAAANDRILAFAREGGTVVVQYNKYEYPRGEFAPYPVSMGRGRGAPRVTDEGSPVDWVDTGSPLYSTPNRLGPADFEGWVQERGLYFLAEWDERFRPQFALADPGEEPVLGSVLVAPVGEGLYVYAALSFFRQFPSAVPGAYRLFANLVSLDPGAWREHLAAPGGG